MSITVNGQTYYRFPSTVWVTVSGGSISAMANDPVLLTPDEGSSTPLAVLDLNGQPWTPVTDDNGQLAEFYAPQYDDVIGDAGAGRQAIRCSELAEVLAGIGNTAAQQALDVLEPRMVAAETAAAAGGGGASSQAVLDLQEGVSGLASDVSALQGIVSGAPVVYITTATTADLPGAKAEAAQNKPNANVLLVPIAGT